MLPNPRNHIIFLYRMAMYKVFIMLMITLMSHHVHSKVITVNANNGNESTRCCVKGHCPCSSLSNALKMMDSNTIINITSEAFTLQDDIVIGSGSINNVTITSYTARVNCSNIMISCESCDDVLISGITWVSCRFALSNCSVRSCALMHGNFIVSGSISIEQSVSSLASPFWINKTDSTDYVNLTISGSTLYALTVSDFSCLSQWNITIINTTLINDYSAMFDGFRVCADVFYGMHMGNVTVSKSFYGIHLEFNSSKGNISVSVLSSTFVYGVKAIECMLTAHSKDASTLIMITDSEFMNSVYYRSMDRKSTSLVYLFTEFIVSSTISLNNVNFTNNFNLGTWPMFFVTTSALLPMSFSNVFMTNVNFISNRFSSIFFIETAGSNNQLIFHQCKFLDNSREKLALLFIRGPNNATKHADSNPSLIVSDCSFSRNVFTDGIISIAGQTNHYIFEISNTLFDQNMVFEYIININITANIMVNISTSSFIHNEVSDGCLSIPALSSVYLTSSKYINNTGIFVSASRATVTLKSSNFIGNSRGCIHLGDYSYLYLTGNILFDSNSADNGAALYMDTQAHVNITTGSNLQFVKNSATMGGAIFIDFADDEFNCVDVFTMENGARVTFEDNIAGAGDSLYFRVPKSCNVNTNTSYPDSLMYTPYHFNYKGLNSTSYYEVDCFNQPVTKFPVITSPYYLLLCGNHVKQLKDATYFIDNIVLGKPAEFEASVLDYFGKVTQSLQFSLNCITCPSDIKLSFNNKHVLIDGTSLFSLTFFGTKLNFSINVTVIFDSFLDVDLKPIEVPVIVELVPCFSHIGYTYSKAKDGCTCYHPSIVKCNEHYNEIEDGYWIGVISSQPTISLCPPHYCSFIHRIKSTLGYSHLPDEADAQCNHHRRGTACGECSEGHTLAYDSTDCISVNHCSTALTIIVILSTCVYWLIIVGGVFTLLYFNRNIPLGYTYGIIYYYSMVGFLFSNNLYVSESAFVFISVMSSFTQLSPEFLGKLCLFKGLSGIDQLFIHYVHAIAISLLVIVFIIVAKFSRKLSDFVSRCHIVRIICLLFLLSYTSTVSTSLQLLRPLRFTDVEEVYTYSSPSVQYFHDRHAVYGTVAIVLELAMGIGLPLLLLLEPFINKYINFVKIKPFLDELQDCYKMKKKYRWFASYYLICRNVILLIVFVGNSYYNRMLFYLLIACVVMATIHLWVRPYKSTMLNIFDGLILQAMVVGVSINIFAFLQPAATELVLVLVIFPLIIICIIGIGQLIRRKVRGGEYIENDEDFPRFVC